MDSSPSGRRPLGRSSDRFGLVLLPALLREPFSAKGAVVAVVGAVLLATGVVLAVLEPIFAGRSAPLYDEDSGAAEAKARRRVALVALRELEYDRATGKLDSADYEVLRAELAHNALAHLALAGGEEEANEDAELEAEIAEMRRALEAGLQCGACEHVNRFGARYCGECGVALADL